MHHVPQPTPKSLNKYTTERARVWKEKAEPAAEMPRGLVTDAFFEDPYHGDMYCDECHGGNPENTNFKTVHRGVDIFPSQPPATGKCAECHSEPENFGKSLHNSAAGMRESFFKRVNPDPAVREKMEGAFVTCRGCHASCGECHTKRPAVGGGGFYEGHAFIAAPETEDSCGSCHKSLYSEFSGQVKGAESDVHFEMGMDCLECHPSEQLHGDGNEYKSMYENQAGPKCINCHEDIYDKDAPNKPVHAAHQGKASCYVCHAQPYNNCFECHLNKPMGDPDKVKTEVAFKIGYNNRKSDTHPDKMVTLRHVPVWKKMFEPDIKDALCNFNQQPTWKMTTPHNIRLSTPQNKTCNTCHGQWDLFLLKKDVGSDELDANRQVIVPPDNVPAPIKE